MDRLDQSNSFICTIAILAIGMFGSKMLGKRKKTFLTIFLHLSRIFTESSASKDESIEIRGDCNQAGRDSRMLLPYCRVRSMASPPWSRRWDDSCRDVVVARKSV